MAREHPRLDVRPGRAAAGQAAARDGPRSPLPAACAWQVKLEPPALFQLHLELATADGNTARVAVGNILKDAAAAAGKVSGARPQAAPVWRRL